MITFIWRVSELAALSCHSPFFSPGPFFPFQGSFLLSPEQVGLLLIRGKVYFQALQIYLCLTFSCCCANSHHSLTFIIPNSASRNYQLPLPKGSGWPLVKHTMSAALSSGGFLGYTVSSFCSTSVQSGYIPSNLH